MQQLLKRKTDTHDRGFNSNDALADANGEAGSVSQVKACAAVITEAARHSGIPVILVGQVTKDGDIAGPRVLEHLVDTVLFLEGDKDHRYRILRALKHRFGSVDEIALLTMTERGLEQVEDPSSELLRDRATHASGSVVTCLIEGRRPLLLEIQALVSPAGYGTPIRRATGVDSARLGMLLAVLAKRAGISALDKDVYANAAGGIDAKDPSADLALAVAIASAVKDVPLDPTIGLFGEIGLAGEIRPVALPELRLKEFARMGFKNHHAERSEDATRGLVDHWVMNANIECTLCGSQDRRKIFPVFKSCCTSARIDSNRASFLAP